jgi:sulfopyruvate decarboxylase TPP-binding subunit
MQRTGLVDSLNAIRAVAMEYGQPICMLVGRSSESHINWMFRLPRESVLWWILPSFSG